MLRTALLTALLLAPLTPGIAEGATKHGITPLSPRAGASVPHGESPLFRLRARGGGEVYVHVCRSKKRRADGLICTRESVGPAKRSKGGVYRYRPRFHDFPGFWLNRPGTYYWQAHRIRCVHRRTKDCRQEGPILRLRVR